jgi:hypothetical protein
MQGTAIVSHQRACGQPVSQLCCKDGRWLLLQRNARAGMTLTEPGGPADAVRLTLLPPLDRAGVRHVHPPLLKSYAEHCKHVQACASRHPR